MANAVPDPAARLRRYRAIEAAYGDQLNERGLRLVRLATFSAYRDLRAAGRGAEAARIVAVDGDVEAL